MFQGASIDSAWRHLHARGARSAPFEKKQEPAGRRSLHKRFYCENNEKARNDSVRPSGPKTRGPCFLRETGPFRAIQITIELISDAAPNLCWIDIFVRIERLCLP